MRLESSAARATVGVLIAATMVSAGAYAHDVAASDRDFVEGIAGPAFMPFLYLGAKHMVTGYDHVLFLIGVVFFLNHLRDVVIYVSMFTLGHSLTLMGGVLSGVGANAYIVDAIIGLSVVYKALENLGVLARLGVSIDTKLAVLVFGLFHGLGLATKLQDLSIAREGLLVNLIGFNLGVEIGQVLVLVVVVTLLNSWRASPGFPTGARYANILLAIAGVLLAGVQISEYARS